MLACLCFCLFFAPVGFISSLPLGCLLLIGIEMLAFQFLLSSWVFLCLSYDQCHFKFQSCLIVDHVYSFYHTIISSMLFNYTDILMMLSGAELSNAALFLWQLHEASLLALHCQNNCVKHRLNFLDQNLIFIISILLSGSLI
jgi:hypothetical protein